VQHGQAGGHVAQRYREIDLLGDDLRGREPVAQMHPVIVHEADLLGRVLRARVEEHRAQPHLQRLLGDPRRTVG